MNDDYQARLYASYHSTHVVHRKGADDTASLRTRGRIWDQTLLDLLPPDRRSRILDGACGNGALVEWMRGRGYVRAEGVDISPEVIADGASLGIRGIKVANFVEELRGQPQAYDMVVLRDVLEHFPKQQVLDVLDVVRAALVPGGRLLLHVPNAESPMFGRVRYGDFTHETAFTASSLTQVLLATGFSGLVFRPSPPVGTTTLSRIRSGAWRALAEGYKSLVFIESGHRPTVVTQNIIAVGSVEHADAGAT